MCGALEDAEAELGAVEASALESGMGLWIGMRRAEIATWRGDWATALPLFEDRYQREQAAGMRHPNTLVWTMDYADCLAGVGRRDEAIELTRELVALSAQAGGILGAGTHQLTLGRLTGDIAELERALAILEPSQYRWMTARAQLELGAALRRDGQRTKARDRLRSALDYAARNDVVPFAQRARQELRLAGARPHSRVRTGVEALTPAEDRIARLAAEGRSNKEIAQQLFVTVKTVETNLVRAYRKLDINSRRDLPTALGQPA
jgi:DNA-binding CsgD family transcriptional regulator